MPTKGTKPIREVAAAAAEETGSEESFDAKRRRLQTWRWSRQRAEEDKAAVGTVVRAPSTAAPSELSVSRTELLGRVAGKLQKSSGRSSFLLRVTGTGAGGVEVEDTHLVLVQGQALLAVAAKLHFKARVRVVGRLSYGEVDSDPGAFVAAEELDLL